MGCELDNKYVELFSRKRFDTIEEAKRDFYYIYRGLKYTDQPVYDEEGNVI